MIFHIGWYELDKNGVGVTVRKFDLPLRKSIIFPSGKNGMFERHMTVNCRF